MPSPVSASFDTFSMGAAMSPSGRYAGGFISIAPDDSYQYSPTIVDLETDEWHQFGPYPESVYALHQTMAVTDQGLLFISDGTNGGQIAIDLNGDISSYRRRLRIFSSGLKYRGTSADGNFWVGFGKKEAGGLYYPLLWIDGAAQNCPSRRRITGKRAAGRCHGTEHLCQRGGDLRYFLG